MVEKLSSEAKMFNILVAEDEKNIQILTKIKLVDEGYNVSIASNGEEALYIIDNQPIDLLVLDLMMPVVDGIEVVKAVRQSKSNLPIIVVSAKGDFKDKALAFSVGVDDYMVKPINFSELTYRIKALLRRAQIVHERKIDMKDVVLEFDSLSITRKSTGEKVYLTKKEFSILFKLLSYSDVVFTKAELFDEFWGINSDSDESTIKVHINQIRNKTKDFPEFNIVNVRGLGYKGVRNE